MDGGGTLTIKAYSCDGALGSRSVIVDIEDEGPGIPEDVRERLFHPFVSSKQGSSGLGLWICQRIADAHNAIIRGVNLCEKRGARFSVEFPNLR